MKLSKYSKLHLVSRWLPNMLINNKFYLLNKIHYNQKLCYYCEENQKYYFQNRILLQYTYKQKKAGTLRIEKKYFRLSNNVKLLVKMNLKMIFPYVTV